MILRSSLAATHLVTFSSGLPDGEVTWRLLDPSGAELETGTIPLDEGAVSTLIPVSAAATTLPAGKLQTTIDVVWSYEVSGAVVNDEIRYTIEARLPLGVAPEGVRRKLGVSDQELADGDIGLVRNYLNFISIVGEDTYNENVGRSELTDMRVRDAIEAMTALDLIPIMPVRVAAAESSGTNQFKRQQIEWETVAGGLRSMVNTGLRAIDVTYDPFALEGDLFLLATPSTDAFTGQTG